MSQFRISRRAFLLRLTCALAAVCAPDPLLAKDGGGGDGGGGGSGSGGGSGGGGGDDGGGSGRGNSGRGGSDRDRDDDGEESGSGSRRRGGAPDAVEVVYPGGWIERVEGGRLRMRDPRGRLVIDRRAAPADIERLRRRAR